MLNDDELQWYHLSVCQNMDINWFFDDYESDPVFAKNVDDICKSCPVRAMCLREGIEGNDSGVWGGVYLINGRMDESRNSHKTEEDWAEIRGLITGG